MEVEMASKTRSILVIGLGGTISMTDFDGHGFAPTLSASEILGLGPTGFPEVDLIVEDYCRIPSASLSFDVLRSVVDRINGCARDTAGVIILQGTDSLEETGVVIDLLLDADIPVALTGAMRAAGTQISDGPANIQAALCYLMSPDAFAGRAVVVFADGVYDPFGVRKAASFGVAPFKDALRGPLGHILEDAFVRHREPLDFSLQGEGMKFGTFGRVWIVKPGLGQEADILAAAESADLDGLVVEAFGGGHVPEDWVAPLEQLAARIPVVVASRTAEGPTLSRTYAYPGGEVDLANRGILLSGQLCPLRSRLVLGLLTGSKLGRAAIEEAFLRYAALV